MPVRLVVGTITLYEPVPVDRISSFGFEVLNAAPPTDRYKLVPFDDVCAAASHGMSADLTAIDQSMPLQVVPPL